MKKLWDKHKKRIIAAAIIIGLLTGAYFLGSGADSDGNGSVTDTPSVTDRDTGTTAGTDAAESTDIDTSVEPTDAYSAETDAPAVSNSPEVSPETTVTPVPSKTPNQATMPPVTDAPPAADASPVPSGSGETVKDAEYVCTMTISCATVLDNIDKLDPNKAELIPDDGVLFYGDVTFYGGESIFNLLRRVTKENKIHFEYQYTPAYNNVYIEGIGNLYEFDCGDLSGWLYRVNGEFYSMSCSEYFLSSGDQVELLYSCDLGKDIGAGEATNSN